VEVRQGWLQPTPLGQPLEIVLTAKYEYLLVKFAIVLTQCSCLRVPRSGREPPNGGYSEVCLLDAQVFETSPSLEIAGSVVLMNLNGQAALEAIDPVLLSRWVLTITKLHNNVTKFRSSQYLWK
jgi:hypothetical protein